MGAMLVPKGIPVHCRGKRFPLPNTYRTILAEHCALQVPVGRDALSILSAVSPCLHSSELQLTGMMFIP